MRRRPAAWGTGLALAALVLLGLFVARADAPPWSDLLVFTDGRRLAVSIEDENDERVLYRHEGKLRSAMRRDLASVRAKEEIYLEAGKEARAAGQTDDALKYFERVRDHHRKGAAGKDWPALAGKELQATLELKASAEYLDVVFLVQGRYVVGRIVAENDQELRVDVKMGEKGRGILSYRREDVARLLRKEESLLAQGDTELAAGRAEEAIRHYDRVWRDGLPQFRGRAAAKLALTLAGLAEESRSKGDLVQARSLLERAAAIAPDQAGVKERLATVQKALADMDARRTAQARGLVGEARKLMADKAWRQAYAKLVEALNLQPSLEGLKELMEQCQAHIQVLSYGDFDDPETLDPLTGAKPAERRLAQFLFNSLITRDEREQFVYDLAQRVETSPSGLVFTFGLQPGVKWSNGQEVTARDVEFTLALLTNPKTHNHNPAFAQFISKVEVTSPYELKIHLRRPFYRPLSLFSFMVLPRAPFTTTHLARDNPFCRQPVTSGPFLYKEGLGTRLVELERNPHYRKPGQPYLTGVRLKRYQDRQSARNDLERGELEMLPELRPLDVDFFDKQPNRFTVRQYKARTIYFLAFNYRKPVFEHRDLRRAIAHAIDRQAILEQFFNAGNPLKRRGGQAHVAITGPFPYNAWAYNDQVSEYKHDPAYAATLLRDVLEPQGYTRPGEGGTGAVGGRRYWTKDGQELGLVLKFPGGDINVEKACVFIADSLRRIGINARLAQKAPRDLHDEVVNQHDFDLVYWNWSFDDTYDAYPLFDPQRRAPGGTNFSGYVNPGLVKLFDSVQQTLNPSRIKALAHEIHRRAQEECVFVFLWQLDQYAAHANELRNVQIHPYHLFSEVDSWKILKGPR